MKHIIIVLIFLVFVTSCNLPYDEDFSKHKGETPEQLSLTSTQTYTLQSSSEVITTSTKEGLDFIPTTSPSKTPEITSTTDPGFGSISGNILGYPYGAIPQLVIVAYEQLPPYHYWYLIIGAGSTYFSMDGYVSSGRYQVIAYDPLGNKGGCVTIIEVKADKMVTCDIADWFGGYRDKPPSVP